MAKINKIKKNGTTIYPLTIPQAVINPATGKSVQEIIGDNIFIQSIEQTTTSAADGGTNIITVTYTNGTTASFQVKNGQRGSSGYSGAAEDLEVIDDIRTGGSTAALSAEQGKVLSGMLGQTGFALEAGYYWNTAVSRVTAKGTGDWGTTSPIPVREGQSFVLTTSGGANARAYAFTDQDRYVQEVAPASTSYTNEVITAPCDGYLYVNCSSGASARFKLLIVADSFIPLIQDLNSSIDTIGGEVPQTETASESGVIDSSGNIVSATGYVTKTYSVTTGKIYRAVSSIPTSSGVANRSLVAAYQDGTFVKTLAKASGWACDIYFKADGFDSVKIYNYSYNGNTSYPQSLALLSSGSLIQRVKDLEMKADEPAADPFLVEEIYDTDDLSHNYFWNLQNKVVGNKAPTTMTDFGANNFACAVYPVAAGTKAILTTVGGASARAYAVTDTDRTITAIAEASATFTDFEIDITEDGYLYVNSYQHYNTFSLLIVRNRLSEVYSSIRQNTSRIEKLEDVSAVAPPYHNNPFPINNETLRILVIGNSFTVDSTEYMPELLNASGIDLSKIRLCGVSYSGRGFDGWLEEIEDGTVTRSLSFRGGTLPIATTSGTMQQLLAQPWDVIVITQNSDASYNWSSYSNTLKYVSTLRRYCTNQKVCIAFQVPWSHTVADTPTVLAGNIAACKFLAGEYGINYFVPVAIAIQNARGTELNTSSYLTRDNWHLNYGVGRYIAACSFFQAIVSPVFNVPMLGNTAVHSLTTTEAQDETAVAVTTENRELCQLSAFYAGMNMFNVTDNIS